MPDVTNTDPMLTVEEVAQQLRVTPQHVRRMCKAREIRAARVGKLWRIRASALAEFIQQAEQPSAGLARVGELLALSDRRRIPRLPA